MHHYRTERIIKTKYRETKVVNYRQENDDSNTLSTCTFLDCDEYRTDYDGQIDTTRCKHTLGIQYKHESKEDIAGFISKPVARPEYGMIYQHKGMLLQNLHHRYLYILMKLPHLLDLEQRIPSFPNCDNYGSLTASIQSLCCMTHQQMIMNCIRLFVTLLKLTIFKKWTLFFSCETD